MYSHFEFLHFAFFDLLHRVWLICLLRKTFANCPIMAFPQLFCVDSVLRFDIAQMPGYILTGGRFNAAARYSLGAAKKWGERQTLSKKVKQHTQQLIYPETYSPLSHPSPFLRPHPSQPSFSTTCCPWTVSESAKVAGCVRFCELLVAGRHPCTCAPSLFYIRKDCYQ